jgi:hypothetical protein
VWPGLNDAGKRVQFDDETWQAVQAVMRTSRKQLIREIVVAESHIATGKAKIAQQRQVILDLVNGGGDVSSAVALTRTLF